MKCFAAIDVGSYELAMKIFEFNQKGGMKQVDHIRHRIALGTDTYHTGKISSARMDELCKVLSEYAEIMNSYKVDAYKAYGTSAIRETENTHIVREQIRMRTGIDIEVLSNSEQRFLHYKAVASKGRIFNDFISKGTAIVDIGGGSIQISLFDNDRLVTTQNIRLGILRIQDMLGMLQPKTKDYNEVLEELIDNQLYFFKRLYMKGREIENIILIDDYISVVMEHTHPDTRMISAAEFKESASLLMTRSAEDVSRRFGIPEETAAPLRPAAALVGRVLKVTKAQNIWCPGVDLSDGIAYEYAEREKLFKNPHDFESDIVAAASVISKRYNGNKERNDLVEKIALEVFDGTKKIHNLTKRDRLLLRIAAILGDCGRYISLEAAAECGYEIIMANEMIGLSHAEREIVANVVRFNKVVFEYYNEMSAQSQIDKETYLRIAKLSAILRVADGVCRSHRAKVNGVKLTLKDDTLVISVDSDESIALEQGFFGRKSSLFEEIFAVKPVLRYKKKSTVSI